MLIEMKVDRITIDPLFNTPIVILRDISNKHSLPIWVGTFEAQAIIFGINKKGLPRPLPYDIMKDLMEKVELTLEKVIVSDLQDNTFYAVIELNRNGNKIQIDSRPSDAIALAVRMGCPIMVSDKVIKKAKTIDISNENTENKQMEIEKSIHDKEELKDWLKKLKPEDFGEYEM